MTSPITNWQSGKISCYKLDAAFANLKEFDCLAKPDDFIEVSLWHNGEGFDVHLSCHNDQSFKLTWGEFKALKKLIKVLDNCNEIYKCFKS